jgi:phosphatidylinositol 3-kinase
VSDTSRLATFLIARAVANPAFATFLHWYLFTECEDPAFGARASAVHGALVNALTAAPKAEVVWQAIRRQTDMVSQLSYIVKELKVRLGGLGEGVGEEEGLGKHRQALVCYSRCPVC